MAVSCVVTTSPGFKELLEKTHFSRGTLKSIIYEYQNTPSLWELGNQGEPSEKYVLNYFNRRTVGTPEQIAVWKGRYRTPHVYETYQDAAAASNIASQWFEEEDIMVYENDQHKWVVMVARPLDVFTIRKNSDAWLQDLQKDVDTTVNSGAVGRYIPDKRNKGKTAVAMDFLGKRLDNFYRQRGLKVKAKWSENSKKWLVEYAPEERGYVDDLTGGIFDWNEGQRNAIKTISDFINDPNSGRYIRLVAKAGSGKTSIINAILEEVNVSYGKPTVIVGALSHKAKSVIDSKINKKVRRKFNIEARTIAGMLGMTMKKDAQGNDYFEVDKYARKLGIPIQSASIVFIDEASMVSEEAMHHINDLVKQGTKIVFIGDNGQLPPIRSTQSPFYKENPHLLDPNADSPVFTTSMPEVRLTERVRQGEDSPLHAIADLFWNYSQGLSTTIPDISSTPSSEDNRLIIEKADSDIVEQMLPLFRRGMQEENPNVAKIVSFTNKVVNALNARIHKELHPEMGDDMNFAVGDLITLYDTFSTGFTPVAYNSEEGIVTNTEAPYDAIFHTPSGKEVSFQVVNVVVKMADGRTVTLPVLEQSAANLAKYEAAKNLAKSESALDNWKSFFLIKNSVADLRFGYASTIHKSQGSTYEVVGVNTTDAFGENKFRTQGIYTALTRASNISIIRGMGSSNAAPDAEDILKANAREIAKRQGKQITGTPLSAEQVAFIKSEVDGVAKIIKDASVTITAMNLSKASPVTVKGVNDFKDGDTSTASAVCKSIINSPNATAQQKAYAKALLPLLAKMDFDILFATEENPVIQERIRRTPKMEHWNAAGSTFPSKEAGLGYDIHIKVGVRKNQVIPEKVLLHEITHALTSNRLRNDAEFRRGIDQLSQYVQEWVRQNKDASQMLTQSYGEANVPFDIYGFRNYQDSGYADFVAEAMSNTSFQELLKQIPAPRESELNTWQKLCKLVSDAFKKLFNISYKQNTTVYDMLIPVIADTMSLTSEQEQRDSPYTEWNIERTTQMMANATELVKAMNVAVSNTEIVVSEARPIEGTQPVLFGSPEELASIKKKAIAAGTFLKAPNGKDTNLTESQWLQVRTKAFMKWFGDWINDPTHASKVVDENGEPLVLYHGTAHTFARFDFSKLGATTGTGYYVDPDTNEKLPIDSTYAMFFTPQRNSAISYKNLGNQVKAGKEREYLNAIGYALTGNEWKYSFSKLDEKQRKERRAFIDNVLSKRVGYNVAEGINNNTLTEQQKTELLSIVDEMVQERNLDPSEAASLSNMRNNLAAQKRDLAFVKRNKEKILRNEEIASERSLLSITTGYGVFERGDIYVQLYWDENTSSYQVVGENRKAGAHPLTRENFEKLIEEAELGITILEKELADKENSPIFRQGTVIPVFLNVRNPLSHDYEKSPFPDKYKGTEYPTGLIAARQVKLARERSNDGVVYQNVRDPYVMDSYGVFSPSQITLADTNDNVEYNIDQLAQLFGEPLPQEKPSIANLNFYSGGAEGSDTEWGNAIQVIGGTVTHYTIDFYDGLSQDEKDRLEKRYQEVRQVLGYNEANDPKTKKLLRRDMLQADNAKEVFAIGTINQETQRVNGGTLYAVTRAQLSGKPIHVFNQADNKWYFYDYQAGAWWQEETPTITQDAALIGTRGINEAGKQAIKDVIAKSTGQQPAGAAQEGGIQQQLSLVFKRIPELRAIGTIEEYASYLSEIFPRSVDKNIYWHGTDADMSNGFKTARRGKGSGALETQSRNDFYLARQAWSVLQYVSGVNRTSVDKNGFAHWNKLWWELKEIMSNGRRETNDWKDLVIDENSVRQAIPNKKGIFNRDSGGNNGKWLKERKADYGYEDKTDKEFFEEILGIRWGEDTFNSWVERNAEIFKALEGTERGIYPAIINTQNPIREKEQNTYYEEQRRLFTIAAQNGNDAILGEKTDNEFGSDVAVVINASEANVHFIGTKDDIESFKSWVAKKRVQQGSIQSPSTGGNEGLPNLSNLKGKTAQYGVEIDPNLIQNYREWLNTHPNGIVAYRVNKATFNTPQAVEQGIIGNPFDWQKYGAGKAVEMFYDWLVNNNNYDEPLATDEFRRAIIERIHSAPEDTPVLYYKELGYPSHATVIGWAISEFNRIKKEKAARDQARGYTDEQAKQAIGYIRDEINFAEGVIEKLNIAIRNNRATSDTYTKLEEFRQRLAESQALLDGLNTGKSQIIINVNGFPQVIKAEDAEKPAEKNIVINDTYELSPVETEKEGYSQGFIIKKKNAEGTPKQGAAQIQRMIDHDELPLGAHIMWQGLTAEELSELNKVKGLNKNTDGSWTVIYTEREMALKKQNNTLLKSPLFGSHELHKLAALTMFKLSEVITQLQEGTVNIEDVLWEGSLTDEIRNTDYKGMDRIDIINVISLDKLFNDLIREEIFNADVNERLQEDFDLAEKAQVIYDNFDAFIRLGYQPLIDLENISIDTEKAVDTGTDQKKGENGEDLTDEEVVALFGSTVEHWQVGFRQVSTFASLSNLIRKHLNRLYVLDKNGEKVLDEYGIERNIDSHEAVSKILKWTQGARNLEDMIIKLEGKIAQEPWVKQLTDVLRGDGNEQFKSQFYSNFKKYFQKYNIIYKEKQKDGSTVTKVKTINRDPFVINTMDMITSLDNSKHIGSFNLWNPRTNSIDTNALANVKQGAEALTKLIEVRKSGNPITTQSNGSEIAEVEAALNALNIPMPSKELLIKTLDSVNVLQTLQGALSGLFETFMRAPSGKADYKFMNNKTQSNYRRIVEAFAPVMGDGLDSVSYEAGKLHYSYVTPSYLSKFVENMKGMRGDVKAFIESEYGNIEGWFRNKANNANQAGGEGWLNYMLDRMMDTTEEARKTRAKFDHVVVLSDDSIAYAEKSPVQYAASMLSMYFYDDHRQSAYFRIPMMSNKQSEEYIKFDRIADNFKEVITDWLLDKTYAQELNRIRAVNFRNNAPAELERLRQKDSLTAEEQQRLNTLEEYLKDGNPAKISSFDENGATFMFMEYLNDYVNDKNSELGKLLRKQINGEKFDETQNESTRFRELLREAIVSNLDARFDEFLRNLSREGFLQLSPSMEVIKVNALKDKLPQGKARGLLEEFFWNDMFMSINMMQLLCTDIAYYKNTEDLQKRFAQWHSPGLRGNTEATINGEKVTDGNTRSMTIADKIEKSDVVETLGRVKEKVLSQARFADNPAARDLMEAQIDKIIDAFKEVNVTDAQAYTSPTGYRKKMAIFGQWSARDEEVYQKILNGTFTAEDLDVLWQPLKPFVYSQITKNGYNPYIPLLKMGIQQKNSEYCLILADALMRSVGEESTLTALFDFMEESHGLTRSGNHWTGTPHDHGIDTIMFNSAVKTGLMGVLDINSMSHDDIVKGLKKFAGVGQNEYDDRYVDTIPFEDYSIQQYNPAHLEGEQQLGSQNRVLVFADMPNEIDGVEQFIEINGKPVSVKQAKINYFKAITENIAISEAGVRERFALDSPSRKIRNVALMRVLQEEIAKDARYGTDLQWACLLDESGNFNVPLSDAIQSDRIQQLLNSIIKNRINKQEISGGPVVQVSNYGTSKNLRIVRNADGTIKYYECYITAYDQQLYEDFGDGKGGIDMEKIQKANPKLLEMIGYRIPTEAKYSMAPLKIVGFLPKTAGEGIMLPKEITTLSGSDFDVDKMYIMRYRLNRTDNSAEFIKNEMEDYYLGNKMSGARVSKEDSAAYRARVTGLVRGTIKPTTDTDHRIMSYWRQQRKVNYEDFAEGRYHNDNLIIATQWGILTSGMAEDQVLASGNFDDVKHVGYMLAAMDNGVQYNTASTMSGKALKKAAYTNKYLQYADTQIQFHKQNMVAAKLIGVFAQANVSHAIVGMSDVEAKIQIPEGGGFSINGVNYKEGATFRVDEEYGLDNATRISTVLAQLLASSVDAVKDPVLNLLNINMDTVNIAVTLVRLGHDLEFIGLFLTHPIIKQLINRYNVEKASGSSNSLMQTLITMQNELMGEDKKGAALQLKYNYNKDFFVREHQLSDRQDAEYLQYRRNMDLTVLEIFKKLNNMAEMFRGVVHTTRYNSITSAVGPYASDTMNNRLKDKQFASNSYVTEDLKKAAEGIIYDENGNEVSIIQAFRDTSSELERELLGKNIIQANDEAYKVYSALKSRMGYMSNKMAREFGRFYMSYYMNMESPLFDLSYENRKEMLDEFPSKFMAAKNQYRDNAFVQAVMMDQDKAGNNILALNTRGLTDTEIQALRSAWSDLYTSEREKGIEDKDNLALKLVEYNFFLGSFGFSPKTFMSLTPNTVKLAIPGYKESLLKGLVMTPDRIDNLLMQFMLNLGYANLGTVKEEDLNWGGDDLLPIETFGDVNVSGLAKVQMKDGSTKWLYVEPIGNSSLAHAYFVDKLGGENQQCFEIDPSKKVYEMKSVVENAEPQSAPAPDPDSGESVAPLVEDNRPIYQRLMVLLTTYSMDDPKLNMLNLQDRFNKLYNAGQERYLSETTGIDLPTLAKIAEVLGVTPEELTKDVNDSENKLNLCK